MNTYLVTSATGIIDRVVSTTTVEDALRQIRGTERLYECPEGTPPQLNNSAYKIVGNTIVAINPLEDDFAGLPVVRVMGV